MTAHISNEMEKSFPLVCLDRLCTQNSLSFVRRFGSTAAVAALVAASLPASNSNPQFPVPSDYVKKSAFSPQSARSHFSLRLSFSFQILVPRGHCVTEVWPPSANCPLPHATCTHNRCDSQKEREREKPGSGGGRGRRDSPPLFEGFLTRSKSKVLPQTSVSMNPWAPLRRV